jgi:hypothetical protein
MVAHADAVGVEQSRDPVVLSIQAVAFATRIFEVIELLAILAAAVSADMERERRLGFGRSFHNPRRCESRLLDFSFPRFGGLAAGELLAAMSLPTVFEVEAVGDVQDELSGCGHIVHRDSFCVILGTEPICIDAIVMCLLPTPV